MVPFTMAAFARDMTERDIDEALRLAKSRPVFGNRITDLGSEEEQRRLWRRLLKRSTVCSGVSEDPDRPSGERMLTFGLGAFVRPGWLRDFMGNPFPFVGAYILENLLAGSEKILLTESEIRHANSSTGLFAVVLASGWPYPEQAPPFAVKMGAVAAFLHAFRGFRINEFVTEVVAGPELDFCLSNHNWRERKTFSLSSLGSDGNRETLTLLGINSGEIQESGREASIIAPLFVWPEVRFYFTPKQQELLTLASSQMMDKEIASVLDIGPDAVGRRFDRIYRRVELYQHPNHPVFPKPAEQPIRRRLLLDYLRNNVQELRPHNHAAGMTAVSANRRDLAATVKRADQLLPASRSGASG